MKRLILVLLVLAGLTNCGTKKEAEEQMNIPEGMSIRSQFTTRMTQDNLPFDDITFLPSSLESVTLYTVFEGITPGSHFYQFIVHASDGQHACPPEGVFNFNSEGGIQNVWSRIITAICLSKPGDYSVKVYLDGNWVLSKKIKVLSEDELKSGQYEAYWNKDKYLNVFPASKSRVKGDWLVKKFGSFSTSISNLFVVTHKGFNRIFFVDQESADNVYIKEYQNYGYDLVFTFPGGERNEPRSLRYNVVDDKLYFYNNFVHGSFDLNTGAGNFDATLPFTPEAGNQFNSPSGNHKLTKNAILDGKPLITTSQYCTEPEILWASWNEEENKVFYWNDCGKGDAYGFFMRDVSKPEPQRLLEEFQGITFPVYVTNNGSDFIFFIENLENQPKTIKVATQVSYYSELGFGPNFYWEGAITLPLTQEDKRGDYIKVDYFSAPEEYLSYRYTFDDYMSERVGEIKAIGRIREGALAGKKIYRVIDEDFGDGDKGAGETYPTKMYHYLVRNDNELIIINLADEPQDQLRIPDLDGKRLKSDLFKGLTKATHYTNQFVSGLHSAPEIEVPNSSTQLERIGVVENIGSKTGYRKLWEHPAEGEIYVKQQDDGSFWRFNGDGTATLYQYKYDFAVSIIEGTQLLMNEYVPYTNQGCLGLPLDFAHVMTPDPSRLKETGRTTTNESVYGFVTEQDEVLQKEYNSLKEAYEQAGQSFKSFNKFMENVPLFLWKDPFGRYVRFIRKEYLAPANCEPILYLYPESTTDVIVDLGDKINVIASNPVLSSRWSMRAENDGRLVDMATSKTYDHIFWEGISGFLPPLEKGFVIDTSRLENFFNEKLTYLGLNSKEREDFKQAWLKEFTEAPYYFIGFYDPAIIDKYAPMTIHPEPETTIRVLMDYKPMHEFQKVEEPIIKAAPVRKGFTVIEWAGLKRK